MQYPWVVYAISEFGHCTRVHPRTTRELAEKDAADYNYHLEGMILAVHTTAIAVPLPWTGE